MQSLTQIQQVLRYEFKNTDILIVAFTHSSYSHKFGGPCNERMEFLGDALLDFVVAEYLYKKYPNKNEGDYTLVRSDVVDTDSLSREIAQLGLIDYLLVDASFARQNISIAKNKKLYADLYEAILCAIYLDGGFEEAKKFIHTTLNKELNEAMYKESTRDFKTMLKEASEKQHFSVRYILNKKEGTDDSPTFYYHVLINDVIAGEGYGGSIKEAQSYAAKHALRKLNLLMENYDKSNKN